MIDQIRRKVEHEFGNALKSGKITTIQGFERADAYGHEAGMPIERWVKSFLEKIDWGNWSIRIYFPNELFQEIFSKIGRNETKILKMIDDTWWGPLMVSKKQVQQFMNSQAVERWQQEGADIIIFYGNDILKDINNIILINAKSHDIARSSRPPNIMSAQRLLEYFASTLARQDAAEMLDKVSLWFLGVDYSVSANQATVHSVHIKDLLLLNLARLPQINFDAAIQIQWHVRDMVEIDQDRLTFIQNLAKTFIEQWKAHSDQKKEKYGKLVERIERLVEGLRNAG